MKKNIFALLVLLMTAATGAWAEVVASGDCGENVTWSLDDEGVLTISGTGAMADYSALSDRPWNNEAGSIKNIVFEDGVTSIGKSAFSGCSNLTSITLPASVTTIGEAAFIACTALTSVTFADGSQLKTINNGTFSGCSNLTSITLPASVTSIGIFAFTASAALTSVTVNAPSCTLGEDAFDGCDALESIYVPSDKVNDYKNATNWSNYEAIITAIPATYKVTLNDGNVDTNNWNITPATATTDGVAAGQTVTLKYNGKKKVKSVKAVKKTPAAPVWDGDLSKLTAQSTAEYATATDGMTIKGALAEGVNVKVSIADGAIVTLDGVTINGVHNKSYNWAGINCLGDAIIVLKDGSVNSVKGFHYSYPGIHVPSGSTLTIQGGTEGTGKLTASRNGSGAGIGGGQSIDCGNISITGGIIEVPAGASSSAGIGGGGGASCGYISITGGTVTATGAEGTAAIGSGQFGSCGDITIASTVNKVTAYRGDKANYTIGKGDFGSCGTVTIGGTKYWENNAAVGNGATYLTQGMIEYQP